MDALRLALWGWGEDRAETEGSPYEGEAQWTPSVSSSEAGGASPVGKEKRISVYPFHIRWQNQGGASFEPCCS